MQTKNATIFQIIVVIIFIDLEALKDSTSQEMETQALIQSVFQMICPVCQGYMF